MTGYGLFMQFMQIMRLMAIGAVLGSAQFAAAQSDPFYGEQTQTEQGADDLDGMAAMDLARAALHCPQMEEAEPYHLAGEFGQWRFVGVLQRNNQSKALFVDEGERIIDLSPRHYLIRQGIQVLEINLKSITYIDWRASPHCEAAQRVTITL